MSSCIQAWTLGHHSCWCRAKRWWLLGHLACNNTLLQSPILVASDLFPGGLQWADLVRDCSLGHLCAEL